MFQQPQCGLPNGAAGRIVVNHLDEEGHRVVLLAGFGFDTEAELEAAWDAVPEAPTGTFFLAVREDAHGVVHDRQVTGAWIAARTGRPLDEILRAGFRQPAARTLLAA